MATGEVLSGAGREGGAGGGEGHRQGHAKIEERRAAQKGEGAHRRWRNAAGAHFRGAAEGAAGRRERGCNPSYAAPHEREDREEESREDGNESRKERTGTFITSGRWVISLNLLFHSWRKQGPSGCEFCTGRRWFYPKHLWVG